MAEIEVARVEAVQRYYVRVHPGIPLAPLYQHRRVGKEGVATDMVEMEMRIDNEINLAGIAVDRFQPGADLLTGREADLEQPTHALAETAGGIMLAIGVQPGIE